MKLAVLMANEQVKALGARLNNGKVQLFDGKVLLAECRFAENAFQAPKDGRAESHPLLSDPDARATGKANRYQILTAADEVVGEGNVSDKDGEADLILRSINIQKHAEVVIDSITLEA